MGLMWHAMHGELAETDRSRLAPDDLDAIEAAEDAEHVLGRGKARSGVVAGDAHDGDLLATQSLEAVQRDRQRGAGGMESVEQVAGVDDGIRP